MSEEGFIASATGRNPAVRRGALLARACTESEKRASDTVFICAHVTQLSRRLPLLYSVVLFNVVVLAASFWNSAPKYLTLAVPAFLALVLVKRALYWMPERVERLDRATIVRDYHRLNFIGPVAAFACTVWTLLLMPYGDASLQALIDYATAVTCFVGILGLGHAPRTAMRIALVTMVPATLAKTALQNPNWLAVCAVQLVVTSILLFIAFGQHADFVALEASRQDIEREQRRSARMAQAMRQQADHDSLTGLLSRAAFLDRLERSLADKTIASPWLALIDLDGFKHVNDTFGHGAGDFVLKTESERIREFDGIEACGRLGGDEFALLFDGDRDGETVRATLKALLARLGEPIIHGAYVLGVTASIGLRKAADAQARDCLERADDALYKAKQCQGGAVVEFCAADEAAMRERARVGRRFARSNFHARVDAVFQPMVNADDGQPVAFEVFARWAARDGSVLAPETFLALADSTGRINELTEVILARALSELPVWKQGGRLAINLSPRDILREEAGPWLSDIVARSGAPPSSIMFEITEAALLTDVRRAAANLEALRVAGFSLALDDFGVGQSSLSHLHRLPLDHLKLDRSFAREFDTNPSARAIAGTVHSMARQLGLTCSIEGIETSSQATVARLLGFQIMQGYYFGRPVSAKDALRNYALAA